MGFIRVFVETEGREEVGKGVGLVGFELYIGLFLGLHIEGLESCSEISRLKLTSNCLGSGKNISEAEPGAWDGCDHGFVLRHF